MVKEKFSIYLVFYEQITLLGVRKILISTINVKEPQNEKKHHFATPNKILHSGTDEIIR
jgi:hypothetical protein